MSYEAVTEGEGVHATNANNNEAMHICLNSTAVIKCTSDIVKTSKTQGTTAHLTTEKLYKATKCTSDIVQTRHRTQGTKVHLVQETTGLNKCTINIV